MRSLLATLVAGLLAVSAIAQEKVDVGALKEKADAAMSNQDWGTAAAVLKKVTEADPKDGVSWLKLGYSLHADKKLDEALKIHLKAAEFPEVAPIATYNVACVYALQGDKDKAFTWLGKAVELGFSQPDQLANDTDMDSLRDDPRFKDLVAKVKEQAGSGGGRVQAFTPAPTERRSARLAFFSQAGSPGQLAIDYGPVVWNDKYDALVGAEKMNGKQWRLGKDFWTNLDSSLALTIGGVDVPAGYYYLTVRQLPENKFALVMHDANEVKQQHLDPFVADKVTGGIECPLEYAKVDAKADKLAITVSLDKGSKGKAGELKIHFGNHELSAKLGITMGGQ
jgi:tetratricopeptide (TPR) repeat protein